MGKKSSASAVSKILSAAPSSSAASVSSNKSSILQSSFAPSALQLHLFASVIQSFESQQLRIHDTNSGRLRQHHTARPGVVITSLDWGYYSAFSNESQAGAKKKRKRTQPAPEEVVIAYGTSASEICMYSPAEGRIVGQLSGAHEKGIKDFKFSPENPSEGWSIGGDGNLVRWDLITGKTRTLAVPSSGESNILCASTTPFTVDFSSSDDFRTESFDSFKNIVHSLVWSRQDALKPANSFLAADNDRYMNIFDVEQKRLTRTLVAGSEVEHIDLSSTSLSSNEGIPKEEVLAVITRDGMVELFSHPFVQNDIANGDIKSKRKSMTRKANAQIKLVQQDAKKPLPVFNASFQGPDLVVVSVDSGVEPSFQKIRWQDEGTGDLLFEGIKEVTRTRSASTLTSATMNGVKDMGKTSMDESRTTVINGSGDLVTQETAIEISSDEEEENDEEESKHEEDIEETKVQDEESEVSDEDMEDAGVLTVTNQDKAAEKDAEMADLQNEEPSFGEQLASKHPSTITIADVFAPDQSTMDLGNKQLAMPSGMSLGTVLTQALRTNDQNLLESCLHANDTNIIQNTIQRLDSGLASALLSKLAERLASRPGRYGHLLSWVQWTCIAHGATIAGQPDVTAKIRTLYQVLSQRSKSFEKLLLLKGKLDMLDAQLTFRKQLQAQRGHMEAQDEPGMIYIEGEEDNWSSEDDHDEVAGAAPRLGFKTKRPLQNDMNDLIDEESSEDEEDMPVTNGVVSGSSDEEEDSDIQINGQRPGGLLDDEAEVSGEDEISDDDEEGDEVENSDEEEEDDEEDSEMDDFINDGSVGIASDEDDIDIDEEDTPRRPATKKSKRR